MTTPKALRIAGALAFVTLLAGIACDDDTTRITIVEPPPQGLGPDDDLPGLNVEILSLAGASGADGSFQVGNRITVTFTVKTDDGTTIPMTELARGAIYVSGPTFNYQRVIASQSDVRERSLALGNGSFSYEFAVPIPPTYLAPLNDTAALTDDELTGQPLLAGTYSVAMELRKDYTIGEETFRDAGNAWKDFRFGGAQVIQPRELVTLANCNQCHGDLRAHGGNRTEIVNCLACHTAGAEDRNNPSVAGGTPGATIEFKVMIHKIHSGANLGSVLGVTTKTDGSRDYTQTPKPYQLVGFGDSIHDYSHVQLPVWPVLDAPMPRDTGYSSLSSADQAKENAMRSGAVSCDKCHGDPDGAGPLPAPSQGDLIYSQPTRRACGSCHDDWVFDRLYTSNLQTMPAQSNDSACTLCHKEQGTNLDIRTAHLHPLLNPALAKGTNINITSVLEAGTNNGDGTIDVGERVQITFTIKDDLGADIPPAQLSRFEGTISGPTSNPNLVLFSSIPSAALGAGPVYSMNMPKLVHYEFVGDSTASNGDTFTTAFTPHWNVAGALTEVYVRTVSGASSTLATAAQPLQNFIDLASGGGGSFARDDFIVIEDGVANKEEYLLVQWVDGDRIWFSSQATRSYSQGLRFSHAASAAVRKVTLTKKTESTDYTLNTTTGMITESVEFGTGNAVVVLYTSDFVMPATYPGTLNESPEMGQDWGDWLALNILDGTYTVNLSAVRSVQVSVPSETTNYNDASPPATTPFLVGDATTIENADRITSAQTCYSCHDDLAFHGGGRRGYEGCLQCHGVAGAEDRPRYVAANAPATTGVTIDFRTMLHKIHQGKDLAQASSYTVVGFGSGYPNNFTPHTYENIGYPLQPGSTQNCASCHGKGNEAWKQPAPRNHPAQSVPTRVWRAACGSCHDSSSATAHIDANTSQSGAESCAICHDPDQLVNVERVHKTR